jgi:Asp-tRNA(Asn)/Glu-tRNA(Gln) amidotransferase A subunit family amidase
VGRHAELSPTFLDFLSIAHREPPLSSEELLTAWMYCDHVRRKLLAEMESFPILLCPVCAIPAFRHGERSWDVDGHRLEYLDAMRYTQWFNLLGAPAAVVPVGRSPEGLPIGVQIAGRPFEDERVLGIAAAVEAGFGYEPPPLTVI